MTVDLAKAMRTTPVETLSKYLLRLDAESFGRISWKAPRL